MILFALVLVGAAGFIRNHQNKNPAVETGFNEVV